MAWPKDRLDKRLEVLVFFVALVVLALLVFRDVLPLGRSLLTTDDNLGEMVARARWLPGSLLAWWYDGQLLGVPGVVNVNWTYFLLWLFPAGFVHNWLHAIDLGLASVFLGLFLRERGCRWPAVALGALAAYWVGSNLTLTYAGHIGKFAVLMFGALCLWLMERAVRRGTIGSAVLAGGAMGGMFLEQQDVALFFAMPLGLYAIYAVVRERGWNWSALARMILPLVVVAGLMGYRSVSAVYSENTEDVTLLNERSADEQWAFATQWSWPPEECIDFIAPGFMGWRSGEPSGPYWGRMGCSDGFEETKQGFPNFKLENQYLSGIAVLFAIWALFAAFALKLPRMLRADAIFWGGVAIVTLLLAFGKYFPLYQLFYALPGMASIRNPNKFLQIFQVSVGILAAFGLDAALRRTDSSSDAGRSRVRWFVVSGAAVGLILFVWGVQASGSVGAAAQRFAAEGWQGADAIATTRARALVHGGVIMLVAAGALGVLVLWRPASWGRRECTVVSAVLLAVMTGDVLLLSRHYIKTSSLAEYEQNEAMQFLKSNHKYQRVALMAQDGFYRNWLTYQFPYHGIPSLNITQMPRMTQDYSRFFRTVQSDFIRTWQLCSVGYLMGPAGVWNQIQQDPRLKDVCELVYAFNVYSDGESVLAASATSEQPGQHCVVRFNQALPRFVVVPKWQVADDDTTLNGLMAKEFVPGSSVFVSEDTADGLPSPILSGEPKTAVAVKEYRSGRMRVQVSADRPAMLRVSEKYDARWAATIDGNPAAVRRVDYIFAGVLVPPGLHDVVLAYSPPTGAVMVQVLAMLLCLAAIVFEARSKPVPNEEADEEQEG